MAYANMFLLARSETSDTFGISRLGEEERSESFPSLVTKLMASLRFCFIFLYFCYWFVCVRWVNYCCCTYVDMLSFFF